MAERTVLRINRAVHDSIVDGPGLRYVVFTQGCPHHCAGCHNPQTHNPNGGKSITVAELLGEMDSNPLLTGLTLSGGEPMEQAAAASVLARSAQERGLDVWCWTGYLWENIASDDSKTVLLENIDVLVDGPFVQKYRVLGLAWRGSSNQRLINVRASLREKRTILYEPA